MDKKERFNALAIDKQVEEFNKLITEHGSINKASKFLNIPKTTLRDSFTRNNYILDVESKQYIKNINTPIEGQTTLLEPVSENKEHIETNMIETEFKHDNLEKFIEQKVSEMFDRKFNESNKQLSNSKFTNKIVISNRCDGEGKNRSFEVYKDVLDEFIDFCKTQPYTIKEMVSQAFVEFMENHK